MKRYWKINHDTSRYLGLLFDGPVLIPSDLYLYDAGIDLTSIPEGMRFKFLNEGKKTRSDFIPYLNDSLLCRRKIFSVFENQCKINFKTFDVMVDDETYSLNIIITELDAFDKERSIFTLFDDGDNIFTIDKLRLKRDFQTNCDLFRLKGYHALRSKLFCSEKFKNIYEDRGYTGLEFFDASG